MSYAAVIGGIAMIGVSIANCIYTSVPVMMGTFYVGLLIVAVGLTRFARD